jgi:hypothetical protein
LALGASAQKVIRGGGHYAPRPRVSVGIGLGYGYGYSPFYSPYYGFGSPFYYPPYGYNNGYRRPSRLDMEIQDIKTDYADQIKSLRMDNSLSGHERRQQIRELKTERDKAITEAQRNYYYKRSAPRQQQNNNHGNNGNGTNNSNGSNNSNNNNDDSSGN